MAIWFVTPKLEALTAFSQKTMVEHLGIEFTAIDDDSITARMPVDQRTTQPLGMLHGGASVALAETLGSVAATLCVDPDEKFCVGLEINANHIRSVRSGYVFGTAKPLHMGRTTQIWQTTIVDEQGRLVAVSRLTVAVLTKEVIGEVSR